MASGTVNAVMHCSPGATLFLLDYDRTPGVRRVCHAEGSTDVELVNIRFSRRPWQVNHIARLLVAATVVRVLPVAAVRRFVLARHPHLQRLAASDVVLSIGGGDSFADIYGLPRLVYVALPQLLALILGKPLIQLPQTIGPFRGVISRAIARFILKRSQQIYARDPDSLAAARRIVGDRPPVSFGFDMAFALNPVRPASEELLWLEEREDIPLVGFNLSGLLYAGGYTGDNMFGLREDYREVVRTILSLLMDETDARVVLIPHVYAAGDTSENDALVCSSLLAEWQSRFPGRLHALSGDYDESELKWVIGRCDFFLGSRMHACIAALSQCVPAVGLAYSRKFAGLWRTVGVGEMVIDLRGATCREVADKVRELYHSRAILRRRLEAVVPDARRATLEIFLPGAGERAPAVVPRAAGVAVP